MNNNRIVKKMASFTMMELVVAMLISSVVISVVFYAYSLVGNQLRQRQLQSGRIMECILFQRAFRRDFERAESAGNPANGKEILLSLSGHTIRYLIDTPRIIRDRDGVTDSFSLGGQLGEIVYVSDSLPLIRSLQIRIDINKDNMVMPFDKEYTSRQLLLAAKDKHE